MTISCPRVAILGIHLESNAFAPSTPEEHERNLRADIAVFTKVLKEGGLRPTDQSRLVVSRQVTIVRKQPRE